ncbi:MAG TPA: hypothetical protein VFR14_09410 [Candidatus Limnocylindrales bacterium]|nr:hypothetical protein [Candidatus Limnocylindrales bacterium]
MNDEPRGVRVYGWSWSSDSEPRPGVPWLGLFLLVFGGLLLLERLLPGFHLAGATFFLALGIVLLARWAIDRRAIGSLYAGAIVSALAAPGVLEGLDIVRGQGLGTLSLGIAFLFIAAVRAASGAGVGWQTWVGVILTVIGGSQLADPRFGDLILPGLIVALGAVLVIRGLVRR